MCIVKPSNNRIERRMNDKVPSPYGVSVCGAHAER
jgi:hypothetical protein